jgi:TfoX/Sxy family transcriptional regulator of competence genes
VVYGAEMSYDEDLADRVREQLSDQDGVTERQMFGGLAFMLFGNMAVGLSGSGELMVRVGPDGTERALAEPHTRLFDMSGRPMRGWILVAPEGVATARQLGTWVRSGLEFARTLPPKR